MVTLSAPGEAASIVTLQRPIRLLTPPRILAVPLYGDNESMRGQARQNLGATIEPQVVLTLGPCSPLNNYTPAWVLCAMMLIATVMCAGLAVMAMTAVQPVIVLAIGPSVIALAFASS